MAKKTAPQREPDAVDKLMHIEKILSIGAIDRGPMIRAMTLAFVAGTNPLFLGPPGTAKTMTVQAFAKRVFGADQIFDILLTKFTTREEVFGPLDMAALKQGQYRHNTEGFAPEAEVVYLDEVFKASSAISNACLRILNERTFRNGNKDMVCAIKMVVGTSNEFPEDPAMLAAFFDRFPIKLMVEYLENDGFQGMLMGKSSKQARAARAAELGVTSDGAKTLSPEDRAEIRRLFEAVEVPEAVVKAMGELREKLKNQKVVVSDRRWVQGLQVMKANAVLDHRDSVTRSDMDVLRLVVWNSPADLTLVAKILPDFLNPFHKEIRNALDDLYAERKAIIDAAGTPPDNSKLFAAAGAGLSKVNDCETNIAMLQDMVETEKDRELFEEAKGHAERIKEVVMMIARGKAKVEDIVATLADDIQ